MLSSLIGVYIFAIFVQRHLLKKQNIRVSEDESTSLAGTKLTLTADSLRAHNESHKPGEFGDTNKTVVKKRYNLRTSRTSNGHIS